MLHYKHVLHYLILVVALPLCDPRATLGMKSTISQTEASQGSRGENSSLGSCQVSVGDKLKTIYKAQNEIPQLFDLMEDGASRQTIADCYVKPNIVRVEDIANQIATGESVSEKKERQGIEPAKLFDSEDAQPTGRANAKKILVLGGAGVGKSTFMQYLAHQWATDKLWNVKPQKSEGKETGPENVYFVPGQGGDNQSSLPDILWDPSSQKPEPEHIYFNTVYKVNFKQYLTSTCAKFIENKLGHEKERAEESLRRALAAFIAFNLKRDEELAEQCFKDYMSLLQDTHTLLLIDGYDEVQHLDEKEGNALTPFGWLKEAVLSYPRLIMTTRPSAATPSIKRRFGVLVENEGLRSQGIEDYLNKHFTNELEGVKKHLSSFLTRSVGVREICRVPVNLYMLCSIVKERCKQPESEESIREENAKEEPRRENSDSEVAGGDRNDDNPTEESTANKTTWKIEEGIDYLSKLTTMGALYKEMLNTLSKRFVTKKNSKYRRGKTEKELHEQINSSELMLVEMKVLEYIAYDRFVAPRGRVFEGDAYLRHGIDQIAKIYNIDFNDRPTRKDILDLGLLKPELSSKNTERKALSSQLFSFTHLTFQEYLTAYHIRASLIEDIQANRTGKYRATCKFIATRRDNPKYLMTWKFLSGLIDDMEVYVDTIGTLGEVKEAKEKLKEKVRQAFWESMLCNVDGAIDLGEDGRVKLFMHLLGQVSEKGRKLVTALDCAKKSEGLDEKGEPIRPGLVGFIDQVVLKDLEKWVDVIMESGYLSEGVAYKLMNLARSKDHGGYMRGIKLASEVFVLLDSKQKVKVLNQTIELLDKEKEAYTFLSRMAPLFDWGGAETKQYAVTDRTKLMEKLSKKRNQLEDKDVVNAIDKVLAALGAPKESSVLQVSETNYNHPLDAPIEMRKGDESIVAPVQGEPIDVSETNYNHPLDAPIETPKGDESIVHPILGEPCEQASQQDLGSLMERLIAKFENIDVTRDRDQLLFIAEELIEMLNNDDNGSTVKSIICVLDRFPLEKCEVETIQEVAEACVDALPRAYKADKKQTEEFENLESEPGVYTTSFFKRLGELPLHKYKVQGIRKIAKKLIDQLSNDREAVKYAIPALDALPLSTPETAQEMAKFLIEILKDEKATESATLALSLKECGAETIQAMAKVLTEMPKNENIAKYVAESLGKLPLNKCDVQTIQQVANKLMEMLRDEGTAESASKAICRVPLKYIVDFLKCEQLKKLISLPTIVLEKLEYPLDDIADFRALIILNGRLPEADEDWREVKEKIPAILNTNWDCLVKLLDNKKTNEKLESLYEAVANNISNLERTNIANMPLVRQLLIKIYEYILSDYKIDTTEVDLMQKLIQSGFTTSIAVVEAASEGATQDESAPSKERYSVTFNGRTYPLSDNLSENNLKKIIATILESTDQGAAYTKLVNQYVDHLPVFPNSGEYLRKASSDVQDEEVISVFDHRMVKKAQCLTLSDVIVTKLVDSLDRSNVYFYKEYRDFLGRHVIEKYKSKKENAGELLPEAISEEYVEGNSEEKVLIKYPHSVNPTVLRCDRSSPRKVTQETKDKLSEIFGRYEEGETKHARPYTVSFKQVARKITDPEDATGKEYDMDKSEEAEGYMRIVARSFSMNASELSEAHGFLDSVGNTWLFHQSLVGMLNGGKITMNTHIARKSGMFGKAELSEAYAALALENNDGYHYTKAFVLTLSSTISAYSQDIGLYTKVQPGDLISQSVSTLIASIPVVGSSAATLISGINLLGKQEQKIKEEMMMKKLKAIARSSFMTNEDLWLFSNHAGLAMWDYQQDHQPSSEERATQHPTAHAVWLTIEKISALPAEAQSKLKALKELVVGQMSGMNSGTMSDTVEQAIGTGINDASSFLQEMCKLKRNTLNERIIDSLVVKVLSGAEDKEDAQERDELLEIGGRKRCGEGLKKLLTQCFN